ncbi:hypothetical protein [Brevibacillus reuszeri]|uniref:hypothetical protein n=1 Tax=Brevibacillus reuszeri TaxID=54915 RepID=UPI002896CF77|nr:hypothetical protein [Brevibacillus reuszeri]
MVDHLINNLSLLTCMAILVEAVTEIFKTALPDHIKDRSSYVLSILIGISLSFALDANPLALEGNGYYVSVIVAGILSSRGANYLNGIVKKLKTASQ